MKYKKVKISTNDYDKNIKMHANNETILEYLLHLFWAQLTRPWLSLENRKSQQTWNNKSCGKVCCKMNYYFNWYTLMENINQRKAQQWKYNKYLSTNLYGQKYRNVKGNKVYLKATQVTHNWAILWNDWIIHQNDLL